MSTAEDRAIEYLENASMRLPKAKRVEFLKSIIVYLQELIVTEETTQPYAQKNVAASGAQRRKSTRRPGDRA